MVRDPGPTDPTPGPGTVRARRPWRWLVPLAGAVLGAHLALLGAVPTLPSFAAAHRSGPQAAGPMVARQLGDTGAATGSVPVRPVTAAGPTQDGPANGPGPAAPRPAAVPHVLAVAMQEAPQAPGPASAALLAAGQTPPTQSGSSHTHAADQAHRAVLPRPMRLRYELTGQARGFPLSGRGELSWRHDGREYEARLDLTIPLASRSQQSTGLVTPQGLAPVRYAERARSEEAAHFDRAAGRITFSGNRPEAALDPGAQDRLSVLIQLGALAAGDPGAFRPGRVVAVQTASARDADTWHFQVEGEEDLTLPGGRQRALHLLRQPRKEFDQRVELWLAPGLDYAPVRLRLTQPSGDWLEQQWSGTDRN